MSQLKQYYIFPVGVKKRQDLEKYVTIAGGTQERKQKFEYVVNRLVADGLCRNVTHAKKNVTWAETCPIWGDKMKFSFIRQHKDKKANDKDREIKQLCHRLLNGNLADWEKFQVIEKLKKF